MAQDATPGADDAARQETTLQAEVEEIDPMDSVEIGLLTCSPHEEVYSLYGHSALRYHDLRTGQDIAYNWGIFNFRAPHFVLRFVFGLTDYELGPMPTGGFCAYYRKWGSQVTEQVLNLTADEKRQVALALIDNLQPENRVYRYNFFYDNCSTRPRDIIERCIDGRMVYHPREDYTPSWRDMVHECVRNHPWAAFGNDLLLGVRADAKTTREQQEFLPQNLMIDFASAQILNDGQYRPLVLSTRTLVPPGVQVIESDFIFSPLECAAMLACLCLLVLVLEIRRKRTYKYFDALLMLAQALAGCVLFVMIFSQHPATSANLQILLLNPLPFFFIPAVLRRHPTRWWRVLGGLLILFALGALWQHYAEGMMILALCLLSRLWSNYRYAK